MKVTDFDLKTLALANRNSANALENLKRADKLNLQRAKTSLVAASCGALGIGTGYALMLTLHLPLTACSFLGCALGLASALLLSKLGRHNSFEAKMEENKAAMHEVLTRIRALPKNAPAEVREELWQIYRSLNVALPGNTARNSLKKNGATELESSGPNLQVPLAPLPNLAPASAPIMSAKISTINPAIKPLTPAQKQAATLALQQALARVEDHALDMALNNAEAQSLDARLQTRQPMEWKQEKRDKVAVPTEQWLEEEGETVFATSGEVFQAGQKVVRPAVFPRMQAVR